MRTRILTIVGKQRPPPLALVRLDGFQYQEGEASDLHVVLTRNCTQVICVSIARNHGASACTLKFRRFVIELGDLLYHNYPEAKVIFLYRHAETWARLMARPFTSLTPR